VLEACPHDAEQPLHGTRPGDVPHTLCALGTASWDLEGRGDRVGTENVDGRVRVGVGVGNIRLHQHNAVVYPQTLQA
jgi:hypothetical protein